MSRKYTAEEFDTYFAIKYDGDSKAFKVAKAGLSPQKAAIIKMACGGKVKNYQEGGEVTQDQLDAEELVKMNALGAAPYQVTPIPEVIPQWKAAEMAPASISAQPREIPPFPAAPSAPVEIPEFLRPEGVSEETAKKLELEKLIRENEAMPSGARNAPPLPTDIPIGAAPSLDQLPKPEEKAAMQQIKLDTAEYDAAVKKKLRAIEEASFFEQKRQQLNRQVLTAEEAAKKKAFNTLDMQLKDINAKKEKIRQDILSDKEDPNRYWHSLDNGRKFASMASVFLSGLGAAIAGAPGRNTALQMFQKNIDRDIEAQRQDLGKKKSILSSYMEQGRDLADSWKLADAYYKDLAAVQLQKIASLTGAPAEKARGEAAAADLMMLAAKEREDILKKEADRLYNIENLKIQGAFKEAQIRNWQQENAYKRGRLELDMKKEENKQARELLKTQGTQEEKQFLSGEGITAAQLAKVDKTVRSTAVRNPETGLFEAATDADSAKKMREVQNARGRLMGNLKKLQDMNERDSSGYWGINRTAIGLARQVEQDMIDDLAVMKNMGVVSAPEEARLLSVLPTMSTMELPATKKGKFKNFEESLGNAYNTARESYLIPSTEVDATQNQEEQTVVPGEQGAKKRVVRE